MKKNLSPEVRQFFAEIGRKNGKKLYEERGSQYFRDIAAKRKKHGRQKPQLSNVERIENREIIEGSDIGD